MSIRFHLLETAFARSVNTTAFSRSRVFSSIFQQRPLPLQRISEFQRCLEEANSYTSTRPFFALAVECNLYQSLNTLMNAEAFFCPSK
jgi:hypothetical protein